MEESLVESAIFSKVEISGDNDWIVILDAVYCFDELVDLL